MPGRTAAALVIAAALLASGAVARAEVPLPPSPWHGTGLGGEFTVLAAVSETTALAGGNRGAVARTSDSGDSWAALSPAGGAAIRGVASGDGRTLYAVDTAGRVWRSPDGGAAWEERSQPGLFPLAVAVPAEGRVLLIARRAIALSRDGGEAFGRLALRLARRDSLSALDRAPGAVFAYGRRTLLRSVDRGSTWGHMRLPRLARTDGVARADFAAPRVGYVLSTARRLFRTRDAGHHWTQLLSTGGAGTDMAFSDRSHGYLAAPGFAYRYDGAVLRTSDGGATWRPEIVAPGFLQALEVAGSTAYALAGGSSAYATRPTGPVTPTRLTARPSARRVRRGGTVRLSGRMSPADGDEQVVVSRRSRRRWIARVVRVAADGSWTSRWKMSATGVFVAQALGHEGGAGAATRPVVVRVAR